MQSVRLDSLNRLLVWHRFHLHSCSWSEDVARGPEAAGRY